jgi:hypothetical protein
MVEIYTFPQLSPEWFQIKLGIVSAGSFAKVLAKGQGKSRNGYMLKLAAEILTGERRDTYQDQDMIRGTKQEPQARKEYEFVTGNSVDQIGFCKRGWVGASPDGLVGYEGGIEIKSVIPEVQIETVIANRVPPSHKAQIQGCLFVCDCAWWDFVSYSPLLKSKNYIFIKRMFRDEDYISTLQVELIKFLRELDALVKLME